MNEDSTQQYPASADHEPGEPSELAKTLHGDRARDEVIDQPDVVAMSSETLIAEPGRNKDAVPQENETSR